MSTVVVLADYPAVRAGLRAMLEAAGHEVIAEASAAAIDALAVGPDVLVVDLGHDPEASAAMVAASHPGIPAVYLADEAEDFEGLALSGPRGLLLRSADPEEVAAAVAAVEAGLVVYGPSVADALAGDDHPRLAPGDTPDNLTDRELEVLDLLAAGLPNKTIALQLGISEHTVKFHVSAILGKLGAAGRTEAVMTAARRGLLAL